MRMNSSMRKLLDSTSISLQRALAEAPAERLPRLVTAEGCVLLADEAQACHSVSVSDFPDRTGFECFINHFHVPYDGTAAGLQKLIVRIAGIQRALTEYAPDRSFVIPVSIAKGECTIRFHECRPGEAWLADDLEGYTEESVAAIGVGPAADC
jgi:hypothetical protein